MSAENKAVVRRLLQEVWNRGNLEVADDIVAPDYVNHMPQPAGLLPGVRGFKQLVSSVRAALVDFQMTLEDLIAEEDKVVARWTTRGTDKRGWPAGNRVTLTEIGIFRIAGGKIAESWISSEQPAGSSFLHQTNDRQVRNQPAEKVAVNPHSLASRLTGLDLGGSPGQLASDHAEGVDDPQRN